MMGFAITALNLVGLWGEKITGKTSTKLCPASMANSKPASKAFSEAGDQPMQRTFRFLSRFNASAELCHQLVI